MNWKSSFFGHRSETSENAGAKATGEWFCAFSRYGIAAQGEPSTVYEFRWYATEYAAFIAYQSG